MFFRNTILSRISRLLDFYNIIYFPKIFLVINNPFTYLKYLFFPNGDIQLFAKTPIGKISIYLNNLSTAKLFYSIFIREDYYVENEPLNIYDLGSNIGLSALYFLSRNINNKVICVEPNPVNLRILKINLEKFKTRSQIINAAISCSNKPFINFYVEKTGVYSSTKPLKKFRDLIEVEVIKLEDLIKKNYKRFSDNIQIIKIDIEGSEEESLKSINFEKFPDIKQIICEKNEFVKERKILYKYLQRKCNISFRNRDISIIKLF